MRLEKASSKAVRFAIMNWHYSKSVPLVQIAYAVFNGDKEWCGVICYSIGASSNIAKPYNLNSGEVIELVRVALNGKQESTSKALSISLKLIKKDAPNVKLIVSFADSDQEHKGTIYQASNWIYVGSNKGERYYIHRRTGKRYHARNVAENKTGYSRAFGKLTKLIPQEDCERVISGEKYKYIYPLDKTLIPMCKALAKPYPKKEQPAAEA